MIHGPGNSFGQAPSLPDANSQVDYQLWLEMHWSGSMCLLGPNADDYSIGLILLLLPFNIEPTSKYSFQRSCAM